MDADVVVTVGMFVVVGVVVVVVVSDVVVGDAVVVDDATPVEIIDAFEFKNMNKVLWSLGSQRVGEQQSVPRRKTFHEAKCTEG